MKKEYKCEHCGKIKSSEFGICPNCHKFPISKSSTRSTNILQDEINAYNDSFLPTCLVYSKNLDIAVDKFKITKEEACKKYGQFSIGQWKELLA